MSHNLNKVEVYILDDRYVLKGSEPQEHMEMLAFQLDKRLKKAQDTNPRLNKVQTVVLTALNLLDELTKIQQEYRDFVEMADQQKENEQK
ncbi:MAG: cell division protein ZapA [Bacillota bacterium]